jgi:hypothetical protein
MSSSDSSSTRKSKTTDLLARCSSVVVCVLCRPLVDALTGLDEFLLPLWRLYPEAVVLWGLAD